jgi:hypothetical protein
MSPYARCGLCLDRLDAAIGDTVTAGDNQLMQVTKGRLIIADPWIDYVLDGSKTWEMRFTINFAQSASSISPRKPVKSVIAAPAMPKQFRE